MNFLMIIESHTSFYAKNSVDKCTLILWTNLVGSAPSPSQAAPIVALLDGGMTVGALTVLAADLDLNTTNIGLVGLVQTGIEYSL
ncbi:MAG: hypothetical protein IPH54_22200 [Rhodoferax sp.]|nr:hypothetical protein [Rhodoferax sp.]